MGDHFFLFDLDSTITAREILPEISRTVGKEKEMREITEKTMQGIVPFKESFLRRVELLKDIPVTEVNRMVAEIPLNEHIAEFIRENHDRCYEEEVIGGTTPSTDNPVLMTLDRDHHVIEFSRERGQLEWTGLAKMRTDRLTPGTGHVYQMLEPLLPIRAVEIHTKEIDTVNDYENAVKWVRNHYRDAE